MAGSRAPFIPPRADPRKPDAQDAQRIQRIRDHRWGRQSALLLARDRTAEEMVRMVAGRQYDIWVPGLGQFVDSLKYLSEESRRWRQRPVINFLGQWFDLTVARLTENPPIISFQPSTADRSDAEMAEAMDTIFKTVWRESGMDWVTMRAIAWMAATGEAYLSTRIETSSDTTQPLVGPASLSMQGQDGQTLSRYAEAVPFDRSGNPMAQLTGDGSGYETTGQPYNMPQGNLAIDVLSMLEVRAEWGSHIPWHKKRWHNQRSYLSPEDVWDRYQVECEPDTTVTAEGPGYLQRMLFGSGHFGATMGSMVGEGTGQPIEGLVTVDCCWEKPCTGQTDEEMWTKTGQEPLGAGRLTCVTPKTVLYDGPRPYKLKGASPIQQMGFSPVPGRPAFTTPLERMVPLQKALNRRVASILEHANRMTNPIMLLGPGLSKSTITNLPGQQIENGMMDGKPAVAYAAPPNLPADAWRTLEMLYEYLRTLGSMQGAEGTPATQDPSGRLQQELRFNADRPVSIGARSAVDCLARMAGDWTVILPVAWPVEKILTYAGDDGIPQTITVQPEMWDGMVNVFGDPESMLPEGRGERQSRIERLWMAGAWGQPGVDPKSNQTFLQLANFPHMGRLARVGGTNGDTARHNLSMLVRGTKAAEIAVYEWYDLGVQVQIVEEYMSSPEYLKLDEQAQHEIQIHREMLRGATIAKTMNGMQLSAAMTGMAQTHETALMGRQQMMQEKLTPPLPPGQEGGPTGAKQGLSLTRTAPAA